MQKKAKAYNSEMVRDTAIDKCTVALKASSNFSTVFELSGVAFRIVPPYGGLLVLDCIEAVLCVTWTLVLMHFTIHSAQNLTKRVRVCEAIGLSSRNGNEHYLAVGWNY